MPVGQPEVFDFLVQEDQPALPSCGYEHKPTGLFKMDLSRKSVPIQSVLTCIQSVLEMALRGVDLTGRRRGVEHTQQ